MTDTLSIINPIDSHSGCPESFWFSKKVFGPAALVSNEGGKN
jgi:hypothetical protein